MRRALTIVAATLVAAAPALAGINPASPGLPTASTNNNNGSSSYTGFSAANGASSALCVDCHTVQPKAGGSHYVNPTDTVGTTNSGGSGIGSTGAIATRDNGAYFKATAWNINTSGAAGLSKYGNGATGSVSTDNTVAGTRTTTQVAASALGGYDIICESCHNIVVNQAGGNNLLQTQPNNKWQDASTALICVGCHGFMYTENTANADNANYASALNDNEVTTGRKNNNEVHWVKGVAYAQNHHVMTGDNIDDTKAAARLLWTDNDVIHYAAVPIENAGPALTRGSLPQRAAWVNLTKPTNSQHLNCTNCHTPAHGEGGSAGASILRNATYTTTANPLGPIARISDRGGWKKVNDLAYCTQCHVGN